MSWTILPPMSSAFPSTFIRSSRVARRSGGRRGCADAHHATPWRQGSTHILTGKPPLDNAGPIAGRARNRFGLTGDSIYPTIPRRDGVSVAGLHVVNSVPNPPSFPETGPIDRHPVAA